MDMSAEAPQLELFPLTDVESVQRLLSQAGRQSSDRSEDEMDFDPDFPLDEYQ